MRDSYVIVPFIVDNFLPPSLSFQEHQAGQLILLNKDKPEKLSDPSQNTLALNPETLSPYLKGPNYDALQSAIE